MATSFRMEHDFPDVPLELFEQHLNHPDLCTKLEGMPAFKKRALLSEDKKSDGEIHWTFDVVAEGNLPAAMKKVITPEMFSWEEVSRFVPGEHCIYWTIAPKGAGKKFSGSGVFQLEKDGKGTKRVIEGEMNVKIPFVGKMIENFLVQELKKNYDYEPDIQRAFYAEMKRA